MPGKEEFLDTNEVRKLMTNIPRISRRVRTK